ncbi:MAG: heavy metal translocating P-type ATPase [Halobacteriota archaeon]|uniref:heavy metal translocating P-type ATPase n=1 Tax=Natronomonas sp. TaxID=2184060 RepID=UPI0039749312
MADDIDVETCEFCGERLASTATEADDGGVFCGTPCEEIARTLGGRTSMRSEGAPSLDSDNDGNEGVVGTFLRIDGMYSATCEAFLEAVATKRDGVVAAEASYVTETVRVDHDPDLISPVELEDVLTTLGYTAYRRVNATESSDGSGGDGTTRWAREVSGMKKRRDETFLGLRYAAGILFGAFIFVPYVAIIYPVQLASIFDWWFLSQFEGAFRLDGAGGFLFLRTYFVMTGIVLFFTGMPVLRGAYVSLRMRRMTTDVLVAATALGAYAYSTLAVLVGRIDIYYDLTILVAASVTAVAFYESAVKRRALGKLTDLTVSQVDTARLYGPDENPNGTTEIPVEDVRRGDELLVREGERIPVGGTLREGECVLNEAVVTGESHPVRKREGDAVVAGSVVTDGSALVRADEGPIGGVDRLTATVWNLQSATHGGRRYADRRAAWVVPAVFAVSIVAGVVGFALEWGALGSVLAALLALIVVSPWAIGLATPLSVATSIEAALERGIVVFDETVFERLRRIDIVVFDKTGTLTTGRMDVIDAEAPDSTLAAAVAVERRASHPVARAIVDAFETPSNGEGSAADGGSSAAGGRITVEAFESHGTGVEGTVDDDSVLVGTPELFANRGWSVDETIERRTDEARETGHVPVVLGRNGRAEGFVIVGDTPRDEWRDTVRGLSDRGLEVVVLTGDRGSSTGFLRDEGAIDHVFAGVSPAAKAETIRRLGDGRRVAMVGDGTNDAMALAVADLGLSLGSGTAMAADAADVAILDDEIRSVGEAFDLARAAKRRLERNVRLAASYNFVALALVGVAALVPVFVVGAVLLTGGLLAANSVTALGPADPEP